MDSLQPPSLLSNYSPQPAGSILLKQRHRLRGESIQAIFRFPKSVIDKLVPREKNKTMKKYRSSGKISQQTIQLGSIGQQLHYNMRQTILNHTKSLLNSPKTSKCAYLQNNFVNLECKSGSRGKDEAISAMQHKSNMKTLSLLQGAIIKADDLFDVQQDLLHLHTSKLPILRKRQLPNRKKPSRKHQWRQSPPPANFTSDRHHLLQRETISRKPVPANIQKPYIRGWDTIQPHQT